MKKMIVLLGIILAISSLLLFYNLKKNADTKFEPINITEVNTGREKLDLESSIINIIENLELKSVDVNYEVREDEILIILHSKRDIEEKSEETLSVLPHAISSEVAGILDAHKNTTPIKNVTTTYFIGNGYLKTEYNTESKLFKYEYIQN